MPYSLFNDIYNVSFRPYCVASAAELGRELALVYGVHDGGQAVVGGPGRRLLLLAVRGRRRGGGSGRVGAPGVRPEGAAAAGGREEAARCGGQHRHWRPWRRSMDGDRRARL